MKRFSTVLVLILINLTSCYAQKNKDVTPNEIKLIIEKIADSLEFYYVDLYKAKQINTLLKANEKQGSYNTIKDPDTLAKKLTADLRYFSKDLHLWLGHKPKNEITKIAENTLDDYSKGLSSNFGVQEVKILDGNIGYMNITSFSNWNFLEQTKSVMTSSLKFIENTDAIIFDVRNNSGGVPTLVAFLCSYLFEEKPVHLAQYYHRYRNDGYGLYTYKYISGKRLTKIPVFILVNNKSASAAEEFAYFLKHQKRAVVIGEATMGAGYGVMSHRLSNRFVINISSEEDINPITKTNFEGVGVIPNIKVERQDAFSTAISLAKKAASTYKVEKHKKLQTLIEKYYRINENLNSYQIIHIIKECQKENLISRTDINRLGYKFLENNPSIAESIFELNTKLYPQSSNVFDSYGDGLKANGKLEEALQAYKKAIEIGELIGSSNMAIYKANIKAVEKLIANNGKKF
ncbi:S41 family peptidase [Winogradskyella sp. R77965]|uniref:S41 family peptidase n=1 Tax=Winogradskyella sp. R77965 TaxID=3093872 RepID=UPI0037DCDB8F